MPAAADLTIGSGTPEVNFEQALDTSPIPMYIFDSASLRFLEVNQAAVRNYGYSRGEFLEMTLGEIRPAEDLARLEKSVRDGATAPDSAGVWRHRRKDGSVFYVEIIRHPVSYRGSKAELIFALDVDARVRAEAETREHGRLAELVAESADALANAGTLRSGLQKCADLLNRYIDAVFVRIWTIGDHPDVLELQASAGALTDLDDCYARIPVGQPGIGRIAETGTPLVDNDVLASGWLDDPERARLLKMAGFIGYPLMVENRVVGVATAFASRALTDAAVLAYQSVAGGMAQFIERKRGEESVKNLAALVENSSDAIVMATPEGKVTFMNRAGAELMGFDSPAAARGLDISELHDPAAWEDIERELVPACIRSGYWRGESRLRHRATGEAIDILLSAFLVRGANGEMVSKAAVIHDIRERKRVEDALRRAKAAAESASRMKSEFLANMSHEIRTPMNGVLAMTELTLETELSEEQRDYLETVRNSADALLRILNDILDFSKIEAGRLTLESIEFDLREQIRELVALMRAPAAEKGLTLSSETAPEVPRVVRGDPLRLRQVMLNLIGNSVKFTHSGRIVIRTRVERAENRAVLHFEVEDTGIGIPPEKQEAIFAAFAQADGSITRRFGGTGLGLSISSRLIELMGGRIWVESAAGKGSTFHFTATF